jgi:hypothetical protein
VQVTFWATSVTHVVFVLSGFVVVEVEEPSGFSVVTVTVPSACVVVVSFVHVPFTHGCFFSTTVVVLLAVSVVVHFDKTPSVLHVLDDVPSTAVSNLTVVPSSNSVTQVWIPFAVVQVGPDVMFADVVGAFVVVQTPLPLVTVQ